MPGINSSILNFLPVSLYVPLFTSNIVVISLYVSSTAQFVNRLDLKHANLNTLLHKCVNSGIQSTMSVIFSLSSSAVIIPLIAILCHEQSPTEFDNDEIIVLISYIVFGIQPHDWLFFTLKLTVHPLLSHALPVSQLPILSIINFMAFS